MLLENMVGPAVHREKKRRGRDHHRTLTGLCNSDSCSQRSGRYSSASGPHRSWRRCMVYKQKVTIVFWGTKSGFVPVAPPPVGRMVSSFATRELFTRGGRRRSAVLKIIVSYPC